MTANTDIRASGLVPKTAFQTLWQSINGQESYELNPWVWVITFKTINFTAERHNNIKIGAQ